jgi:hypothetical protein
MKIMIIDTQGPAISEAYRALLPGLRIRGYEPDYVKGTPCHEHGALCGWLAAAPVLGAGMSSAELIFVRIFDELAHWIPGSEEYMLRIIEQEKPDYISRSWGAWDGDDGLAQFWAQAAFSEFGPAFRELQKKIGFVDFGAAGNSDENDRDNDVDYPQCDLLDLSNIIGACRRDGHPTIWTGDGEGVLCLMWGDQVYSPDMSGRWVLWSGTSAATPKACGACAAMLLNRDQWRDLCRSPKAERPYETYSLPHPKFGWGCMEKFWQENVRRLPEQLLPPPAPTGINAITAVPEFFNYRRIRAS